MKTDSQAGSLRAAASRITWRVFLLEWLGSLLCILLGFAWLQIADSHVWQFIFSVLSGALLVVGFCWVQSRTFQLLRRPRVVTPFEIRTVGLLALAAFWLLLWHWIGVARDHQALYAGYWNSRLSASHRSFFTYARLVRLQDWFWDLMQWALAALLIPMAVEGGSTEMPSAAWKRVISVYRHWAYWVVAILCGLAGSAITRLFIGWKPGKGVAAQIASTFLRVGVSYTVDIFLWCFVLALAALYLALADA